MEKKQLLQQALKQLNDYIVKQKNLPSSDGLFVPLKDKSLEAVVTISSSKLDLTYTVFLQSWAPQKDWNSNK